MEEQEYRDTYHSINERRCVFEKTINSRRCTCSRARRFNLADREGIACSSATGNALCGELIDRLRRNARFALHLTSAEAPLPHAKEIKVQTGGLLGLQALVRPGTEQANMVEDAISIIDDAVSRYGGLEALPYDVIVQAIVRFEGRKRRPRKHDD